MNFRIVKQLWYPPEIKFARFNRYLQITYLGTGANLTPPKNGLYNVTRGDSDEQAL